MSINETNRVMEAFPHFLRKPLKELCDLLKDLPCFEDIVLARGAALIARGMQRHTQDIDLYITDATTLDRILTILDSHQDFTVDVASGLIEYHSSGHETLDGIVIPIEVVSPNYYIPAVPDAFSEFVPQVGLRVMKEEGIIVMKAAAYLSREKKKDLRDIQWACNALRESGKVLEIDLLREEEVDMLEEVSNMDKDVKVALHNAGFRSL